MTRRLAAIMFTDISGFTHLAQKDEASALKLLKKQESLVRPLVEAHHGRTVKSMGDGLLLEFPDVLDAVECGAEIERRVHDRNIQVGGQPLAVRVGIHLGDVQRKGSDIVGDAVNIASRIESMAAPEGVCVSLPVYDQVRNKVDLKFESLGPATLKGVQAPLDIYRVVFPWSCGALPLVAPAHPRLAVLPFQNISPDPGDEYFADGMTEELTSVLSQLGGLRVIARASVGEYRHTTKSIAQIGYELGVCSLLSGTVRKTGDHLRITVQLIDARTQENLWAHTYDRKLEDVFAVQEEIAEHTAGALKIQLANSERRSLRRCPTTNLAAYEFYLRGIEASQACAGIGRIEEHDRDAVRYFEEAIRMDPKFSEAHSRLANHLIAMAGDTRSMTECLPRARELASRALELNPNSADVHTVLGNLAMQGDLDWPRAEVEFQQAIDLDPGGSTPRFWYAILLQTLQRFDEATKQYLEAAELDPLWTAARFDLVGNYSYAGDFASAISLGEGMAETHPDDERAWALLGWAYSNAGRHEQALACAERMQGRSDAYVRSMRAAILVSAGRRLEGRMEAKALLDDWGRGLLTAFVSPPVAAVLHLLLGEVDEALSLLEENFRTGDKSLWFHYLDPLFDSVREHPRFVALLAASNLPTRPVRLRTSPLAPNAVAFVKKG